MGTFKDLDIFKMSINLTKMVYAITANFPETEKFLLTTQLRRATISVTSNIAEGSSRRTANERRHFLDVVIGSLNEVQAQLIIASELNYIDHKILKEVEALIDLLRPKIFAFYKTIKTRPIPVSQTPNP